MAFDVSNVVRNSPNQLLKQLLFVLPKVAACACKLLPAYFPVIMAKSKKQVREFHAAKEAAKATVDQLDTCNDAYTSGAFKYLRFLVHLLAAAQFSYGIYYYYFRVHWPKDLVDEDELKARWGGKFKYLTFLDVILQALYHTLALLNDLFGDNTVTAVTKSKLRSVRDYIFSAFAFPVAHNVCLSFWVVYMWDRELIFPSALDAIFPRQVQWFHRRPYVVSTWLAGRRTAVEPRSGQQNAAIHLKLPAISSLIHAAG